MLKSALKLKSLRRLWQKSTNAVTAQRAGPARCVKSRREYAACMHSICIIESCIMSNHMDHKKRQAMAGE